MVERMSLIQLHRESERLARIAQQRAVLLESIGTGNVQLGSSFEATLKIGHARRSVRASLERAEKKREELSQAIGTRADEYIFQVNLQDTQLKQMDEMVASGDLPFEVVEKHRREFEELRSLPQHNDYLRRGIEMLRDEFAFKDWLKVHENVTIPNGKIVGGRKADLLNVLSQTSTTTHIDADDLAHRLFPDKNEAIAVRRLSVLLSDARKELAGSGWSIENIAGVRGEKGKYYLKRE